MVGNMSDCQRPCITAPILIKALSSSPPNWHFTNQDKGECSDERCWKAFSTTPIAKRRKRAESTWDRFFAHYKGVALDIAVKLAKRKRQT